MVIMEELISLYEQYIELVGEELSELAVMASVRGWKSSRVKQGEDLREKIRQQRAIIAESKKQNANLSQ